MESPVSHNTKDLSLTSKDLSPAAEDQLPSLKDDFYDCSADSAVQFRQLGILRKFKTEIH